MGSEARSTALPLWQGTALPPHGRAQAPRHVAPGACEHQAPAGGSMTFSASASSQQSDHASRAQRLPGATAALCNRHRDLLCEACREAVMGWQNPEFAFF